MAKLKGKKIILGITGSIAAVKAPMIARELMRQGAKVSAALTPSALHFTTPLALSALTHQEVITELLPRENSSESGTWHIKLAREADAMLIAPCSATTLGKLRAGIYDNALTLLASALPRHTPLILAPAMDEEMWLQPAVQENLRVLEAMGAKIILPISGLLASGLTGQGRMKEPDELVNEFALLLLANARSEALSGKRVLITGGPTYEPIDPVRFIGNRSSGKMAIALANAAERLGASVTLIMGPTHLSSEDSIRRVDIETAEQMRRAVQAEVARADIIIMNAAVSDFSAASESPTKLKKRELTDDAGRLSLELHKTADILTEIANARRPEQMLIGFALETGEGAEQYALGKLSEKMLDMIVLNRADEAGAGFGTDTNRVVIFTKLGDRVELPMMSKEACAREIIERVATLIRH